MSEPLFVTKQGQEYTQEMLFVQLMQRVTKLEERMDLHNKVMRQILETLDTHQHVSQPKPTEYPNYWLKQGLQHKTTTGETSNGRNSPRS